MQIRFRAILIGALVTLPLTAHAQTFLGADWQRKTPAESGIDPQLLKVAIDFAIASESRTRAISSLTTTEHSAGNRSAMPSVRSRIVVS